jgi:hypothetical protein
MNSALEIHAVIAGAATRAAPEWPAIIKQKRTAGEPAVPDDHANHLYAIVLATLRRDGG